MEDTPEAIISTYKLSVLFISIERQGDLYE